MNTQNKKEETPKGQTIGRSNARELSPEEVALVSGGLLECRSAGTCCGCGYDDIPY